jgi:hemoglobin/transferrin/lactoferrin receptor protein
MAGRQCSWTIIAALAAFLAAAPAAAQTDDADQPAVPADSGPADGEPAEAAGTDADAAAGGSAPPTMLKTISVTATRNPIEAFEYPGMVTVVSPEEIETLQPSTPDDVLKLVPGVEFVGGPRRTGEVPSIRGFDGPDVVVMIDGARQNFNSGHDGRFFIDPSLIREAEVLRGSASALYGSGGTGGVIEFRTVSAGDMLDADETVGATAGAGYHTVNEEGAGTLSVYGKPGDGLGMLGSFTKRNSGPIDLGDGSTLENSDDDIIAALGKIDYTFNDVHRVEASYLHFQNEAEEPNNAQGLGGADSVEKDIRNQTWRVAYGYRNPDDPVLDLDVVAYYTQFQADELRLDDLGAGPAGELLKRDVDTVGMRVDNRSRWELSDEVHTTFTYGVETYRDVQDGEAGGGAREGVPDAESLFYGVFGQAEIAITEPLDVVPGELLIIPGLRFDSYTSESDIADENTDTAISPRIGVSWLPTEWSLLFVNYGEAFRAPTYDELYTTGTHFVIPIGPPPGIVNSFVPNPDLQPQTTETIEFGAGLNFDDVLLDHDRFQIRASQFYIDGEDFIDLAVIQPTPFVDCNPFIPGNCNGTTTSTNVPNAELWGREVEASYENDRVLVRVGYSEIHGKNEDTGAHLGVLTPPQVTTDTAVKLPEIESIIGWRIIAATDFDEVNDPSEERDGYVVNDVYFAWAPSDGPLEACASTSASTTSSTRPTTASSPTPPSPAATSRPMSATRSRGEGCGAGVADRSDPSPAPCGRGMDRVRCPTSLRRQRTCQT